jgi:hypothetical protein
MKLLHNLILSLIFLTVFHNISAHEYLNSKTEGKLQDSKALNNLIYLHTDRSCYLTGESVQFKAYLLNEGDNKSLPVNDTLKLSISDQYGVKVTEAEFPLSNNLISGIIDLPEFMNEGNYILLAYTLKTRKISPEKIFSKVIEIRKPADFDLFTDLSLNDTTYESGSLLKASLVLSGTGNKPVQAGFTYRLMRTSGEVMNGKGKTTSDGKADISLKLPEFSAVDELKLIVCPSFKGNKTSTGVVIPTKFNHTPAIKISDVKTTDEGFRHLIIRLNPIDLSIGNNKKMQLDITVLDENGNPVRANLSVSASDHLHTQPSNDDKGIVNFINKKMALAEKTSYSDTSDFFIRLLQNSTMTPGIPYIVQEKNNIRKLQKKEESANRKKQYGYSSERNIFDILMQVKPYHIENGKITFSSGTMNSLNNLDGALIIVDGINKGSDISLLSTIPVPDIALITASTNVMDIQRYSASNNVGIIEITMKKNSAYLKNNEAKTTTSTLFWGPDIVTDNTGRVSVSFSANDRSSEILINVNGITANGLCGSSTLYYSIK